MSYQGFNWSPYFDHVADHQRRNQPPEANESYQRHTYQPAATHTPSVINGPSQDYSSAQNSAERNTNSQSSRYAPPPGGFTNSSSESTRNMSQDYFDSRRLPPYSAPQTSINTSAMSNLVYASSLAQEQRPDTTQARYGSMQHIVDYNRYSQPTSSSAAPAVYGMTSTTANGYEQRSDSRGSGTVREEHRPSNAQNNHSASISNAKLDIERYNRSDARPSSRDGANFSRFAPTARANSHSIAHPKRPTSAKQTKTIPSKPITASNHSQSMQTGSAGRTVSNQKATEPSHVAFPTSNYQAASTSNSHVSQNRSANSEQNYHLRRSLSYQPNEVQPHESLSSNNRSAHSSRETDMQNQTTVNPSHIFNHYEFQKRQATAETSRKVAEEAAAKIAPPAQVAAPTSNPAATTISTSAPARVSTSAFSAEEDSAANRKNQMELEMMQMIEKMRDYKAKDPALFSQIWEQVKKVNNIVPNYLFSQNLLPKFCWLHLM